MESRIRWEGSSQRCTVERRAAEQALNHARVMRKAPNASRVPLQAGIVDNLRSFRSQNKLKKAALHIIAPPFRRRGRKRCGSH